MRFAFKKLPKEGTYRSFQNDYTDIKLNGKICGCIFENKNGEYRIQLMIIESGKTWRNRTIKKVCKTEKEARDFLNDNIELILHRYQLHLQED